jgi:aminopeptidase N
MLRTATLLFFTCLIFELQAQPIQESLLKTEMMRYGKSRQSIKRSDPGPIDVRFVELSFEPNMTNGDIIAASAHYVFWTSAGISKMEFDLRKELTVDSVKYQGQKLSFSHSATHLLNVDFPQIINAGSTDSLTIFYHGKTDMSTRAYSRNVNASGPNIATLSEPYHAHYWWPCRENLTDKIDSLNVVLTVDTPYLAVSNGKLVNTAVNGAKRTFEFQHRYPIATYLVAVTFARYHFYIQQAFLPSVNQSLDIRNYVFQHNDLADAKTRTSQTVGVIRLFDSLFGTYPFHKEHYGHAQFSWSGGMEHQTMSFMTNFNFDLIAHELAHQWFGDKVTCGSWKDIWLNESFATYSNFLCYDFLRSDSEWISVLKRNKADVMSLPDGSVYAYDTTSISSIFNYRTTYQKGALVLHQLRWLLGDTIFFKAVKGYLSDTGLAYDFAREKDLRYYFEKESGMSLTDYFNDWIYGEGYPEYDITWAQKGKDLSFHIIQTQSDASVNQFNVPLPLLVRGFNTDTLLRIPMESAITNSEIRLDFRVREVIFDPREWLLAKHVMRFSLPEANITVFPNPFNGFLYLSLEDMDIKDWEIVDATGKEVISKRYEGAVPKGSIEKIDCNSLANGVYLIRIQGDGRNVVKRIVKH